MKKGLYIKKELYMLAVGLVMAVGLTACSKERSGQGAETQAVEDAVEAQTAKDAVEAQMSEDAVEIQTAIDAVETESEAAAEIPAQEYRVNMTSAADSTETDTDYEIDDMLPRPSDDTFIMSVEDALELMNKNADGTEAAADEQQ